jgi:hypothetical protein
MNRIKDVLQGYLPEVPLGGGRAAPKPAIDRERLRADLRRVVTRNQLYFNLAIGMALLLFAGLIAAVVTHLDRPEWIRSLSIATGVSFMGTIKLTADLWKTKVAAETVMALAGVLPEDALKASLRALINKI